VTSDINEVTECKHNDMHWHGRGSSSSINNN